MLPQHVPIAAILVTLILFQSEYFVGCSSPENRFRSRRQLLKPNDTESESASNLGQSSSAFNVVPIFTPECAAKAISSIPFLKELVNWKDTFNEDYYTRTCKEVQTRADTKKLFSHHVVEYTGRLWFLRKSPIRFQECVRFLDASSCGTHSSVECITKYKTGSKSDWIHCSRVICTVSKKSTKQSSSGKMSSPHIYNPGCDEFELCVESELLVRLPLFGIRKKVTNHISDTFENAVKTFLEKTREGQ